MTKKRLVTKSPVIAAPFAPKVVLIVADVVQGNQTNPTVKRLLADFTVQVMT